MRVISQISGVSLASVSRILAGDPLFHVREETRQRVLNTASQLGYEYIGQQPGEIKKIGCVLNFTAERYSDKYFTTIISAIDKKLNKTGFSLASLYYVDDIEKVDEQLKRDNLSGLLVFDDSLSNYILERFKASVPYIVGVDTDYQGIDTVSHDEYRTGAQAIEHLMERGHHRIAYISGNEHRPLGRDFAYKSLMNQRGFPILPGYFMNCGWEPDRCRDMILELCKGEDRPTAIFAGSDNLAIAVLSAVNSLGLSIPGDVAVASVNNLDFSAYTTPALTTVSIPMEEIGAEAVDVLLRRINGFSGLPVRILYPTTLIIRNST